MLPSQLLTFSGWTIRASFPVGPVLHPLFVLLHGWTGDENSMWIFTMHLPKQALIIAPRGIFPTPQGGYGWHPGVENRWPQMDDFSQAVEHLRELLSPQIFPDVDYSKVNLIGFSQGAALAWTFLFNHPDLIHSVAGLSGFLPAGAESLSNTRPLKGKHVFVSHGTQDDTVPIARARQAIPTLETAGAEVMVCEANSGHKVSASCFRGLEAFIKNQDDF